MTSHTHLYAKVDELGNDYNAAIKNFVSDECRYLAANHCNTSTRVLQFTHELGILFSAEQSQPQQLTSDTSLTSEPPPVSSRQVQPQPFPGTSTMLCEFPPAPLQVMESLPTTSTFSSQISSEPASAPSQQIQVVIQPDKGRKITFDNFDIYQEVNHMTEQNQNKDRHYVTVMSTENRISRSHLRRDGPICDITALENGKCVPDQDDHTKQRNDYIVLVARIITTNIHV